MVVRYVRIDLVRLVKMLVQYKVKCTVMDRDVQTPGFDEFWNDCCDI